MQKTSLSLTTVAIATALIAVLAQVTLPIGTVPFSLLTIGVGLVASLLKPREALLTGFSYLLLGAIGLPVFAGFSGGAHILIGATGGYLWGIPLYLITTSYLLKGQEKRPLPLFLANFLGDALLFVTGVIGLLIFAKLDVATAVKVGVLPFIIPDVIKLVIISLVVKPLLEALKTLTYFKPTHKSS